MLLLSVRGFLDYAGPTLHSRLAWLPCCLPPTRNEVGVLIYGLFAAQWPRPPMPLVYASKDTSRCPLQDSRSGWIRYFLSCRALASPTTCRFIPAHSGLPVICPNRTSPSTLSVIALLTSLFCEGRTRLLQARYLAPWMETSDSYVVEHRCGDAAAEFPFDVQVNRLHAISRRAWKCGLNFVNRLCNIMAA